LGNRGVLRGWTGVGERPLEKDSSKIHSIKDQLPKARLPRERQCNKREGPNKKKQKRIRGYWRPGRKGGIRKKKRKSSREGELQKN